MRFVYHRDILFSTICVFIVIFLLKLMVVNIHFLDPVNQSLKDFEMSDIIYSRLKNYDKVPTDTHIVIINIGNNDREGIARQLAVINHFKPAVIGMDITFEKRKENYSDSLLAFQMKSSGNLVKACYFDYPSDHDAKYSTIVSSDPYFDKYGENAFVNFVAAEKENTIRYFAPVENYNGKDYYSFPALVAGKFDPAAFSRLKSRLHKTETINYKAAIDKFIVFDADEINPSNRALSVIKDKIVLLGYLGPDLNTAVLDDNHFTPLNRKYSGKSYPDMYGVVIQANIIAMILENNYVHKIHPWLAWFLAFLICYFHMYFFISYYVHKHLWFHLYFKSIQLISSIVIAGLAFFCYLNLNIKIDPAALLVPVVLSVDILYFYDAVVIALHRKFGYRTYFMKHEA